MPLVTITDPHYKIVCDECGEADGSEDYGGWILYEDPLDALRNAQESGWRVVGDVLTCPSCLEEEALAVPPPGKEQP